jgi:hypothetical protein
MSSKSFSSNESLYSKYCNTVEDSINLNSKVYKRNVVCPPVATASMDNINNSIYALYNDCISYQKPKNTHKYNTWELTMEHEGIPVPVPEKKNIFVEALTKLKSPNEIINPRNVNERLEFKHHSHFISITINGKKKFFDLFEIYKNSKGIEVSKKKKSNWLLRLFKRN